MVTKIAEFITKAINSFRDLSTETKTTILTITAIVAASGPIMSGYRVYSYSDRRTT